ncbi:hydroxypyruvate isomerase [Litoreibacter ascidiaceicola]|uniref:Hydroxypyruvate isomerase n=1 Tax=Litoreibacter ascidiaceicola TaxID=1486859 RepID=A0A1M4SJL3_9RHOB|nr:TIM barrel protein [Litoreibacter ascidiaceicola]SHE32369.1 hydroxypyruvate isomerase [Litoreibacter ascidiaceicola]
MVQFSANLGFLWNDLPLPDAILKAKDAGFVAVELHWPYATPSADVRAALDETGLPCLGLNTQRGDVAGGDNGCAAIPGREAEARGYIDEALAYARDIGAPNVHVMAGFTDRSTAAKATFAQNLRYACAQAALTQRTILIEPLNSRDAKGYHIGTIPEAQEALAAVDLPNLKIMFDCYHLQIMQGELVTLFTGCQKHIGHVQFAAVPDRGEPDTGEVDYKVLLPELERLGWNAPFGAEYKPRDTMESGLKWMNSYR